jgi:hypothetical protein
MRDVVWILEPVFTQIDQEARNLVTSVYRATDGRPLIWRMLLGMSAKQAAVDYAVERGWIVVEKGHNVCLTVKGARLVRDAQS